mmetsp:Transcript_58924/g.140646  ORF Transcript_58924/g.140646 Transcript_58924/m.140646 type:complete len:164 (-) Transcript_58924:121-612(-)
MTLLGGSIQAECPPLWAFSRSSSGRILTPTVTRSPCASAAGVAPPFAFSPIPLATDRTLDGSRLGRKPCEPGLEAGEASLTGGEAMPTPGERDLSLGRLAAADGAAAEAAASWPAKDGGGILAAAAVAVAGGDTATSRAEAIGARAQYTSVSLPVYSLQARHS